MPTTSPSGAAPNGELFPTAQSEREGLTRLIERLQARLGPEQVQRLQPVEDHRPECGSRSAAAGGAGAQSAEVSLPARQPAHAPAKPRRLKPATQRSAKAVAKGAAAVHGGTTTPSAGAVLPTSDAGALPTAGAGVFPTAASSHTAVARPARPVVRPTWLLTEPEPLPERQSRPLLGGEPLQLLSGPERIEAGWWDSGLAERDYFIAQAADGALVWIYRARLPLSAGEGRQGWFMQGRFG